MNKEEKLISMADDYMKLYGTLNTYDVKQLFDGIGKAEKYKIIVEHLDKNYDFIDGKGGNSDDTYNKTWYFKKLKDYFCKHCNKPFKSPNHQMFCCDNCRTDYHSKKEQEFSYPIY